MTQEESVAPTAKKSAMSGRAVVTMVPSRPSTKAARAMTMNSIVTEKSPPSLRMEGGDVRLLFIRCESVFNGGS